MKGFKQFSEEQDRMKLPVLDEVFIVEGSAVERLDENRKWVSGRFDRNIGIDQPTHGVGQQHAHVQGRTGNDLVVVNVDGSASHGMKGRLHADDADALRARGFNIAANNVVEWVVIGRGLMFLAEGA